MRIDTAHFTDRIKKIFNVLSEERRELYSASCVDERNKRLRLCLFYESQKSLSPLLPNYKPLKAVSDQNLSAQSCTKTFAFLPSGSVVSLVLPAMTLSEGPVPTPLKITVVIASPGSADEAAVSDLLRGPSVILLDPAAEDAPPTVVDLTTIRVVGIGAASGGGLSPTSAAVAEATVSLVVVDRVTTDPSGRVLSLVFESKAAAVATCGAIFSSVKWILANWAPSPFPTSAPPASQWLLPPLPGVALGSAPFGSAWSASSPFTRCSGPWEPSSSSGPIVCTAGVVHQAALALSRSPMDVLGLCVFTSVLCSVKRCPLEQQTPIGYIGSSRVEWSGWCVDGTLCAVTDTHVVHCSCVVENTEGCLVDVSGLSLISAVPLEIIVALSLESEEVACTLRESAHEAKADGGVSSMTRQDVACLTQHITVVPATEVVDPMSFTLAAAYGDPYQPEASIQQPRAASCNWGCVGFCDAVARLVQRAVIEGPADSARRTSERTRQIEMMTQLISDDVADEADIIVKALAAREAKLIGSMGTMGDTIEPWEGYGTFQSTSQTVISSQLDGFKEELTVPDVFGGSDQVSQQIPSPPPVEENLPFDIPADAALACCVGDLWKTIADRSAHNAAELVALSDELASPRDTFDLVDADAVMGFGDKADSVDEVARVAVEARPPKSPRQKSSNVNVSISRSSRGTSAGVPSVSSTTTSRCRRRIVASRQAAQISTAQKQSSSAFSIAPHRVQKKHAQCPPVCSIIASPSHGASASRRSSKLCDPPTSPPTATPSEVSSAKPTVKTPKVSKNTSIVPTQRLSAPPPKLADSKQEVALAAVADLAVKQQRELDKAWVTAAEASADLTALRRALASNVDIHTLLGPKKPGASSDWCRHVIELSKSQRSAEVVTERRMRRMVMRRCAGLERSCMESHDEASSLRALNQLQNALADHESRARATVVAAQQEAYAAAQTLEQQARERALAAFNAARAAEAEEHRRAIAAVTEAAARAIEDARCPPDRFVKTSAVQTEQQRLLPEPSNAPNSRMATPPPPYVAIENGYVPAGGTGVNRVQSPHVAAGRLLRYHRSRSSGPKPDVAGSCCALIPSDYIVPSTKSRQATQTRSSASPTRARLTLRRSCCGMPPPPASTAPSTLNTSSIIHWGNNVLKLPTTYSVSQTLNESRPRDAGTCRATAVGTSIVRTAVGISTRGPSIVAGTPQAAAVTEPVFLPHSSRRSRSARCT